MAEARAGGFSNSGCILANSRRENQSIQTAECGNHGPDAGPETMDEDSKGQFCPVIPRVHGLQDLAHVARNSRNAEEAGLVIENLIDSACVDSFFSHQVSQNARIDRSRARAHHQSIQRSEPHSRVDTAATVNGCKRTTISKMSRNKPERSKGLS